MWVRLGGPLDHVGEVGPPLALLRVERLAGEPARLDAMTRTKFAPVDHAARGVEEKSVPPIVQQSVVDGESVAIDDPDGVVRGVRHKPRGNCHGRRGAAHDWPPFIHWSALSLTHSLACSAVMSPASTMSARSD